MTPLFLFTEEVRIAYGKVKYGYMGHDLPDIEEIDGWEQEVKWGYDHKESPKDVRDRLYSMATFIVASRESDRYYLPSMGGGF